MQFRRPPTVILSVLALAALPIAAQEARIEQARQFEAQRSAIEGRSEGAEISLGPDVTEGVEDDSFGVQQFLKRQERLRPFRAFAEVSAFYTDNVALTRDHAIEDAFLVATFGFEYRRAITSRVTFDATAKLAAFRYDEVNALDFNSLDVGSGLSYRPSWLWDTELFARYNFTNLVSAETDDTFFKNHTITFGAQRAFVFGRAHYAFAGASALFGFADPKEAQRNEFSAYAGYHLQATRRFEADLLYRYGYFVYGEGGRRDHNQTIALSLRYEFTEWFAVFASAYFGINRSNQSVFDYDAGNLGGGLGLSFKF